MSKHSMISRSRSTGRLALRRLQVVLAVAFLGFGVGFLFLPAMAADLGRAGLTPISRLVLGSAHLAGGLALLIPRWARFTTFVLVLIVSGSAVYFQVEGLNFTALVPTLLVFVLLILGVGLTVRRRVDALI